MQGDTTVVPDPSPHPGSIHLSSFRLLTPPDQFCVSLFGSSHPLGLEYHRGKQYPAINWGRRGALSEQLEPRTLLGQAFLPLSPLPALAFRGFLFLGGGGGGFPCLFIWQHLLSLIPSSSGVQQVPVGIWGGER